MNPVPTKPMAQNPMAVSHLRVPGRRVLADFTAWPQCLHLTAAARMTSAQAGHRFVFVSSTRPLVTVHWPKHQSTRSRHILRITEHLVPLPGRDGEEGVQQTGCRCPGVHRGKCEAMEGSQRPHAGSSVRNGQ